MNAHISAGGGIQNKNGGMAAILWWFGDGGQGRGEEDKERRWCLGQWSPLYRTPCTFSDVFLWPPLQPVLRLEAAQCSECELLEALWFGHARLGARWTVCPANFSASDARGIFTYVQPGVFHVNLACYDCNPRSPLLSGGMTGEWDHGAGNPSLGCARFKAP